MFGTYDALPQPGLDLGAAVVAVVAIDNIPQTMSLSKAEESTTKKNNAELKSRVIPVTYPVAVGMALWCQTHIFP